MTFCTQRRNSIQKEYMLQSKVMLTLTTLSYLKLKASKNLLERYCLNSSKEILMILATFPRQLDHTTWLVMQVPKECTTMVWSGLENPHLTRDQERSWSPFAKPIGGKITILSHRFLTGYKACKTRYTLGPQLWDLLELDSRTVLRHSVGWLEWKSSTLKLTLAPASQ